MYKCNEIDFEFCICNMKQLGVFLLSPGWDASPSPALIHLTHLEPLSGERHSEG